MQSESTSLMANGPGIIAYQKWIKEIGITDVTAWRWRKSGLLEEPKNINGRLYLTTVQIARFNARLESGEFSKDHKTPQRDSLTA